MNPCIYELVQKAADRILWESPHTGRVTQWVRYPHYPIHNTENAAHTMGTGLTHGTAHTKKSFLKVGTAHIKALQAKWILNYSTHERLYGNMR